MRSAQSSMKPASTAWQRRNCSARIASFLIPKTSSTPSSWATGLPGGSRSAEIIRVLRPGGMLFSADNPALGGRIIAAGPTDVHDALGESSWKQSRKPWPGGMDVWSHPRHAADGNAVSGDELVGPPRRIRWVTGPQQEISNMVTAAGRSFFAGVLARDSFNGLRLWQSSLNPSPRMGVFRTAPRRAACGPSPRPTACWW